MVEAALLPLAAWQNFYVIVGTAAATLTGLLFVVITLLAQTHHSSSRSHITVFATSNVFHFGAVLLVSLILSAPWQTLWQVSLPLDLAGLVEVIYMLIVLWLALHRLSYQPVFSDWLWYTVLPIVSYTALIVAALVLPSQPVLTLFVIAAATILLLFIGIHNAWDVVTYMVFDSSQEEHTSQD